VLTGPGRDDKPPAEVNGTGVQEAHARQMLAEARQSMQLGDFAKARLLADKVRAMNVVLNRPGDDSPDAIYRALAEKSASAPRLPETQIGGGLAINQPPPRSQQPEAAPGTPMQDNKVLPAALPTMQPPPVKTEPQVVKAQPARPAAVPNAEAQAAQSRALLLMAEAHQYLREDRLLEARQKVQEAQKVGAVFRPDQETPELVSQQIAARVRLKVEAMLSQAKETFQAGVGDPLVRLQKAEDTLGQARQLAVAFGQDAQPIEQVREQILGFAQASSPAQSAIRNPRRRRRLPPRPPRGWS
jgi:hypothetical protein